MGKGNPGDLGQSLHTAFRAQRLSRPPPRDGAHQRERHQTESGTRMKLATFEVDGRERIGVAKGEEIADLTALAPNMIALITNWPALKGQAARIAADTKPQYKAANVHLLAPVPRPQKILAIGLN